MPSALKKHKHTHTHKYYPSGNIYTITLYECIIVLEVMYINLLQPLYFAYKYTHTDTESIILTENHNAVVVIKISQLLSCKESNVKDSSLNTSFEYTLLLHHRIGLLADTILPEEKRNKVPKKPEASYLKWAFFHMQAPLTLGHRLRRGKVTCSKSNY